MGKQTRINNSDARHADTKKGQGEELAGTATTSDTQVHGGLKAVRRWLKRAILR